MERRFESNVVKPAGGVRTTPLIWFVRLVVCCWVSALPLQAQAPITFSYFYDDLGQLKKVVDSTGVALDYRYDPVGNILES